MDIDLRYAYYVIWGLGSVSVWGLAAKRKIRSWKEHDDPRSARELIDAGALFLTAFLAAVAVLMFPLLKGTADTLLDFLIAVALGAFLGAGIVRVTDNGHSEIRKGDG